MDQEMLVFLEAHFRESNQRTETFHRATADQIEALRQEMLQLFGKTDERFEQVDRRFEQVDRRFEQVDRRFEQVDRRFEQVDQRFEKLEETTRHTLVLVEGLRHEIQLIAEGFMFLSEKLDRLQGEMTLSAAQFKEWIEPYYRILDARIRALETTSDLKRMDILDAVRAMLGKPPLHQQQASET